MLSKICIDAETCNESHLTSIVQYFELKKYPLLSNKYIRFATTLVPDIGFTAQYRKKPNSKPI